MQEQELLAAELLKAARMCAGVLQEVPLQCSALIPDVAIPCAVCCPVEVHSAPARVAERRSTPYPLSKQPVAWVSGADGMEGWLTCGTERQ